jgi:hypothetical protein
MRKILRILVTTGLWLGIFVCPFVVADPIKRTPDVPMEIRAFALTWAQFLSQYCGAPQGFNDGRLQICNPEDGQFNQQLYFRAQEAAAAFFKLQAADPSSPVPLVKDPNGGHIKPGAVSH